LRPLRNLRALCVQKIPSSIPSLILNPNPMQ
jgi:hypothetical protein